MGEELPKYNLTAEQLEDARRAANVVGVIRGENEPIPDAIERGAWYGLERAGQDVEYTANPTQEGGVLGDESSILGKYDAMLDEAHHDNELASHNAIEYALDKESIAELIAKLAAEAHDSWRTGIQSGFVEKGLPANAERLKPSKNNARTTEDQAWFAARETEGETFQTDDKGNKLANTNVAFDDLPPSWQEENATAANYDVGFIAADLKKGASVSDEYIIEAASQVHDGWMQRNSWDAGNPNLIPYHQLPDDEKQKDIDRVCAIVYALRKDKEELAAS